MVTNHRDSEGLTQGFAQWEVSFLKEKFVSLWAYEGFVASWNGWCLEGDVGLVITVDTFDCLASITANCSGHKLHVILVAWFFETGSLVAQTGLKL